MTDLSAPPPPLPLSVNIQLNYDDYRRARGLHQITARTFWLQLTVLYIALFALLHAYQGRLGTILMTACTSIVILLPIFVRREQFDANKNLHQPFSIIASENGVDTRYAYAGFQTQWNGFLYFVENKHDLLLYWQTNYFLIFPKRFFSPEQLDEFTRLVRANVRPKSSLAPLAYKISIWLFAAILLTLFIVLR